MKKIVNNFYSTLISKAEEIHEKDFISFLNLNRIKKEVKVAEIEYFKLKGLPCDGGFLSKKDTLDFLKKNQPSIYSVTQQDYALCYPEMYYPNRHNHRFISYYLDDCLFSEKFNHALFDNMLCHTRLNEIYSINPSEKILFIEEIQSDWFYRPPLSVRGDYVLNPLSKSWISFILKNILFLAAQEGCLGISWIRSSEVLKRVILHSRECVEKIIISKETHSKYKNFFFHSHKSCELNPFGVYDIKFVGNLGDTLNEIKGVPYDHLYRILKIQVNPHLRVIEINRGSNQKWAYKFKMIYDIFMPKFLFCVAKKFNCPISEFDGNKVIIFNDPLRQHLLTQKFSFF